jgi:hypothetical protein
MIRTELAELRGEIFGCKILLLNCISFIAGLTTDPAAHLETIQTAALEGTVAANPSNIRPHDLDTFRSAAAGIVVQAIESAKVAHELSSPHGQA